MALLVCTPVPGVFSALIIRCSNGAKHNTALESDSLVLNSPLDDFECANWWTGDCLLPFTASTCLEAGEQSPFARMIERSASVSEQQASLFVETLVPATPEEQDDMIPDEPRLKLKDRDLFPFDWLNSMIQRNSISISETCLLQRFPHGDIIRHLPPETLKIHNKAMDTLVMWLYNFPMFEENIQAIVAANRFDLLLIANLGFLNLQQQEIMAKYIASNIETCLAIAERIVPEHRHVPYRTALVLSRFGHRQFAMFFAALDLLSCTSEISITLTMRSLIVIVGPEILLIDSVFKRFGTNALLEALISVCSGRREILDSMRKKVLLVFAKISDDFASEPMSTDVGFSTISALDHLRRTLNSRQSLKTLETCDQIVKQCVSLGIL